MDYALLEKAFDAIACRFAFHRTDEMASRLAPARNLELTRRVGVPKPLFELRVPGLPGPRNSYVVAADGRRFLVTSVLEEATSTPTTVVLNWGRLEAIRSLEFNL
jgi:hypothetical protein